MANPGAKASKDISALAKDISKAIRLVEDKMLRVASDKAIHPISNKRGV